MDICAVLSGTGSGKWEGGFAVKTYSSQHALRSAGVYSCCPGLRCMLGVVVCVLAQRWPFSPVWEWEGWSGLVSFQRQNGGQRVVAGAEEAPCGREGKPPYYEGDRALEHAVPLGFYSPVLVDAWFGLYEIESVGFLCCFFLFRVACRS